MRAVNLAVSIFCTILFGHFQRGYASCVDNDYRCRDWAQRGECTRNPRYMRLNCQKSCNLCLAAQNPTCVDKDYRCRDWAQRGECTRNPRYMRLNCQKSCNLCLAAQNPTCVDKDYRCRDWAQRGECTRNPRYMRLNCQKSCNLCLAAQNPTCVDNDRRCRDWAQRGECSRNPRYMRRNCQKSCNICSAAHQSKILCNFVTCSWGQWSSWSATCGQSVRQRKIVEKKETTRRESCKGLRTTCSTIRSQSQSRSFNCNCNYVLCLVGEWSSWSTTCGAGQRTRTVDTSKRIVMRKSCDGLRQSCSAYAEIESRTKNCTCNYVDCVYGEWSSWSSLCGAIERKRTVLPEPRNASLLTCDGLTQHCPSEEEIETTTRECGVESDMCYLDGKAYASGEMFIEKNCTNICFCQENSQINCSSLCPPNVAACPAGEYEVEETEYITGSNCSCSVRKCVKNDATINTQTCGLAKSTPSSSSLFIIGGKEADVGDWPWMIAVVKVSSTTQIHCGATLINTQWALSAAHCFSKPFRNDPKQYILRIGEHKLDKKENEVERRIRKIILHENYVRGTYDNDIALLHFDRPIEYTQFIKPICINDGNVNYPPGLNCMVTGWGRTQNEIGPFSLVLQQLEIPLISHQSCSEAFDKLLTTITQNMICAGYLTGEKDSCGGDSGGPLMCRASQDKSWQQVGIVSFGKGCARSGVVGVYTKVNNYGTWVKNQLSNSY